MKKIIKWFLSGLLLLVVLLLALVGPIDTISLDQQPFYQHMKEKLDTFQLQSYHPVQHLQAGWSKFSIVPDHPMPMAGYKPRDEFQTVHDTLYMRIMAIDNGGVTAYMITADLLLFPPALKDKIQERLKDKPHQFVYFSASHTHTGVGGWDPSLLGQILMGSYDEDYVERLAAQTLVHMDSARLNLKKSRLKYIEQDAGSYVSNRINRYLPVDGKFRGLVAEREDGSKGILFVFGAHATFINKKLPTLSGDFPNAMIRELQENYDYAQFMAGAVGSQRFRGFTGTYDFELVDKTGKLLANLLEESNYNFLVDSLVIETGRLQVEHGRSQLRLTSSLKVRDWLFRLLSKPLEAEITYLKIGNMLWLGTSCDFSGEIVVLNEFEKYANARGLHLVITSFNGEYTGYITADRHYFTSDDEEVRILNWVGPYFGEYYSQIIKGIMNKAATTE